MKKIIFKVLTFTFVLTTGIYSQDEFVTAGSRSFLMNDTTFNFLGFNAYYLQSEAADSRKRYIIDDVFQTANELGVKVIRTWAFYESDDTANINAIRYSPYVYNPQGFEALDYMIQKAKENNLYLILTLSNNYKDIGGVPQYVEWANKYLTNKDSFNHNDFFEDDSIKSWFKNYMHKLLNRKNIYTGIKYKNETAIFSFELMNEAENPRNNFQTVLNWYSEMSAYFKSIDQNHLLTTGEIGYDAFPSYYSDIDLFYNSSGFLFNGFKGTSFIQNSELENIDYISYHCYPDGWGLTAKAGINWIKDHIEISNGIKKPVLLGEFGIRDNKENVYNEWLNSINSSKTRSAIVWHYLHPDVINNDGYGFNEFNSPELISLFKEFIQSINDTLETRTDLPEEMVLHQNYPNPFNPVTTIKYKLPRKTFVTLELFNILGERIRILDKGIKEKGEHELILSFDDELLVSGVYIYSIISGSEIKSKKMLLLK